MHQRFNAWSRGRCAFAISTALSCTCSAIGASADIPESLKSLAESHANIMVVTAELVDGTPPTTRLIQIVTHQNGDYAARYWPVGTTWKDVNLSRVTPDYFVFFSQGESYSRRPVSPWYTHSRHGYDPLDPPTAGVHQLLSPWPYVQLWATMLLESSDVEYASDAGVFTAASKSVGISLSWNDQLQVLQIIQRRPNNVTATVQFDKFDTGKQWVLPRSVRLIAAGPSPSDATPPLVSRVYTSVRFNNPSDEALLQFDPITLGVYRYEASTGNVYNHDGSLLYNEHTFLKQAGIPTAGTQISKFLYAVLVLAGIGSGWRAYREVAAGRLIGPGERWLTCAIAGGRVLVGLFFLLAVVAKMSTITYIGGDPAYGMASFASVIERHGVIPSPLVSFVAYLAIGLETALGMALLAHRRVQLVASTALGFIALLSAYLGLVWMMRGNVSCGCLGTLTSDQLSSSLVRNLVTACLIAPSVIWKSR